MDDNPLQEAALYVENIVKVFGTTALLIGASYLAHEGYEYFFEGRAGEEKQETLQYSRRAEPSALETYILR